MKPSAPRDETYWADHDISQWRGECQRGFVSDERFGKGQTVIKRTNRNKTRDAYRRFGGAAGKAPNEATSIRSADDRGANTGSSASRE